MYKKIVLKMWSIYKVTKYLRLRNDNNTTKSLFNEACKDNY